MDEYGKEKYLGVVVLLTAASFIVNLGFSGTFVGALMGGYLTRVFAEKTANVLRYLLSGYIIPFWTARVLGIVTTTPLYLVPSRSDDEPHNTQV